jgi:molecular chaperone GrpE
MLLLLGARRGAARAATLRPAGAWRALSGGAEAAGSAAGAEPGAEGAGAPPPPPPPPPPPTAELVAQLQDKVAKLDKDNAELKEKVLYSLAEMENVRRRTQRDVSDAREYAIQKFAKALLPTADNLIRAIEAVPKADLEGESSLVTLVEGLRMVDVELGKVLAANGVSKYGEVGDKFDPQMHEAMMQMEHATIEPGHVAFVMTKGYKLKDRVLRPAQVGMVRAKAAPKPASEHKSEA